MPVDEELEIIEQILDTLKRAPRFGNDRDEPEGARWIQITDTLANRWAEELRIYLLSQYGQGARNGLIDVIIACFYSDNPEVSAWAKEALFKYSKLINKYYKWEK